MTDTAVEALRRAAANDEEPTEAWRDLQRRLSDVELSRSEIVTLERERARASLSTATIRELYGDDAVSETSNDETATDADTLEFDDGDADEGDLGDGSDDGDGQCE